MSKMIELSYEGQNFDVYLAEPTGQAKGGIILIHEVWGLADHIKSVADRFAAEGYVVLAPELLSETDIAEKSVDLRIDLFNPAKRSEAQPKLRALTMPLKEPGFAEKTIGKLEVCFETLYSRPDVDKRVAVIGFCFGGSYSYSFAVHEPRLKAAVPFYGHASTDIEELRQIKCPLLAFYGELDKDLMNSLPELKEKMKAAAVDYTAQVYSGCGHAFFNDSNPFAYNPTAASDAWQRTLKFLENHLA